MRPEVRVSRNNIRPRNVYRISTYRHGDPPTKTGSHSRYVFVIGKVGIYLHCIKLNNIPPSNFITFLNKIRDKRIKIKDTQRLEELLFKFSSSGQDLFNKHVKPDSSIYTNADNNYRTYALNNIVYVSEIRFENGFLQEIFEKGKNVTGRKVDIKTEINERDG